MANPFVHLELSTPDLKASQKFYGEMFGWTFNDVPMGPDMVYSLFQPDSGPGGGIATVPGSPTWLAYIGVDDIDAAKEKAVALGATVTLGPHEVPGQGWMLILKDPSGAPIALWKPATP